MPLEGEEKKLRRAKTACCQYTAQRGYARERRLLKAQQVGCQHASLQTVKPSSNTIDNASLQAMKHYRNRSAKPRMDDGSQPTNANSSQWQPNTSKNTSSTMSQVLCAVSATIYSMHQMSRRHKRRKCPTSQSTIPYYAPQETVPKRWRQNRQVNEVAECRHQDVPLLLHSGWLHYLNANCINVDSHRKIGKGRIFQLSIFFFNEGPRP